MSGKRIRFDEFELDPDVYQLRRSGQVVRLERIPFALLHFLVERHGELLSREEIAERVWGKDIYLDTENGINTAIRKIRRALQDNAGTPRFVVTVSTKGYRFIAQVNRSVPSPNEGLAAMAERVMLAVLPFVNLSNDPEQEFFVDGLTEETITDLGEFGSDRLGVIARTSAMNYKNSRKAVSEIGSELGVAFVVGGSVRREGDQLRISVQLVQSRDQTQIWAHSYNCQRQDVLKVQVEFGRAIADQVRGKLIPGDRTYGGRTPTKNQEAHDAFLRGRFHLWRVMRPSIERAIEHFQEATRIDPQMAVAYAGLADAYDILPITSDASPSETFPKAEQAAVQALKIDPDLAEAHATLSSVRFWYDWDWAASEEHARRSLARNPSYSLAHLRLGHLLSNIGRHEEAIDEIEIARRLDPLSLITNTLCAQFRFQAGRYEEVGPLLARMLELEPRFWVAQILAAKFSFHNKRYDEALIAAERARDFSGGNSEALALIGAAYGLMGKRGEAEAVLAQLLKTRENRYVPACNLATICLGMGKQQMALDWLDTAIQERDVHLVFLSVEPQWQALRNENRFQKMLLSIGFPPHRF